MPSPVLVTLFSIQFSYSAFHRWSTQCGCHARWAGSTSLKLWNLFSMAFLMTAAPTRVPRISPKRTYSKNSCALLQVRELSPSHDVVLLPGRQGRSVCKTEEVFTWSQVAWVLPWFLVGFKRLRSWAPAPKRKKGLVCHHIWGRSYNLKGNEGPRGKSRTPKSQYLEASASWLCSSLSKLHLQHAGPTVSLCPCALSCQASPFLVVEWTGQTTRSVSWG